MRMRLLSVVLIALATAAEAMDLNSYRAKHGRAALRMDPSLSALAYSHALDLARRGRLDHAGFSSERAPLGAAGENVSYGCGDEACAIRHWAGSARHRAAMLRKDVTTYGLASVLSASGRRYWVMELGGAAPVVRSARRGERVYLEAAPARQ